MRDLSDYRLTLTTMVVMLLIMTMVMMMVIPITMMIIRNVFSIFSKTQSTLMTRMHTKSRMQPNSLNLFKKITIIRLGTMWCFGIFDVSTKFGDDDDYIFSINYDYDDVYNVENQYLFQCEKNNENCGSFSSRILIFPNDWNVQCDAQELLKFKGSWLIMILMIMAMMMT